MIVENLYEYASTKSETHGSTGPTIPNIIWRANVDPQSLVHQIHCNAVFLHQLDEDGQRP